MDQWTDYGRRWWNERFIQWIADSNLIHAQENKPPIKNLCHLQSTLQLA